MEKLFIFHNGDTANGSIEIGYVTGLTEGVGFRYGEAGNFYPVYTNTDLIGTVSGYKREGTDGDEFTFGVYGFDMYAKFNGVEFFRWTDYRHMDEGQIATQANSGYGFRNITARNFSDRRLSSDYSNKILNLADFGLKSTRVRGKIDAGSNQLHLDSPADFNVGEFVIVETGGESGNGLRGSRGVGGAWPTQVYRDVQQMQADASQQQGLYAWVEDSGAVYRWNGSSWIAEKLYYIAKAIPKALTARIENVSADGKILTLDKSAVASTSAANVYSDNWYVIQRVLRQAEYEGAMNWPPGHSLSDQTIDLTAITPDKLTIYIPAGDYAIGKEFLEARNHSGWHFKGAGKDATRIFSPDGTPSAQLRFQFSPGSIVSDFHLEGNAGDDGFMLSGNPYELSDTKMPHGASYPYGILLGQESDGSLARDLKVTDVFQKAVGAMYCKDCWAENVENYMTEGLRMYVQWMFQWSDAVGGGCIDCSVTSNILIPGFEAFKSKGVQFIRPRSTNAIFAMNSAGNFLIEDAEITIVPMSQHTDGSFSEQQPIVNINSNIDQNHPYLDLGGTIRNLNIVHEGYINEYNDLLRGIVVNDYNPNINIEGGYVEGPGWAAPSSLPGVNGVTSTGENTIVDGMKVVGSVSADKYPGAQIAVLKSGVIRNCVADQILAKGTTTIENCTENGEAKPWVQLTANATTVASGEAIRLTWTSTGAEYCDGTNFSTGGRTSGETEVVVYTPASFTATCTNAAGSVASSVSVEVESVSNQPPIAEAGPDITINDGDGDGIEQVRLDGSASYDPDGSILSYEWYEGTRLLATGSVASASFSEGDHQVNLLVTDDKGDTDSDAVTIRVKPPSSIRLEASSTKVKGNLLVNLLWSGVNDDNVRVYRDRSLISTVSNSGAYAENLGKGIDGPISYQICEVVGTNCSDEVFVEASSGGGSGRGRKNN